MILSFQPLRVNHSSMILRLSVGMSAQSRSLLATYAIQNTIGVVVFGGLLLTNLVSVLLHSNPGGAWIWAASISLYRVFGRMLDWAVFGGGQGPAISLAILGLLTGLPILSFVKRSWLGTAVVGHAALGMCVLLASDAIGRATMRIHSASLAPYVETGLRDTSAILLVILSAATLLLCVFNHIVFFRRA